MILDVSISGYWCATGTLPVTVKVMVVVSYSSNLQSWLGLCSPSAAALLTRYWRSRACDQYRGSIGHGLLRPVEIEKNRS